jgi:hypothetical protein
MAPITKDVAFDFDACPDEEASWRPTFAREGRPLAVEDPQVKVGHERVVAIPPLRFGCARFSRSAREETTDGHAVTAEHKRRSRQWPRARIRL